MDNQRTLLSSNDASEKGSDSASSLVQRLREQTGAIMALIACGAFAVYFSSGMVGNSTGPELSKKARQKHDATSVPHDQHSKSVSSRHTLANGHVMRITDPWGDVYFAPFSETWGGNNIKCFDIGRNKLFVFSGPYRITDSGHPVEPQHKGQLYPRPPESTSTVLYTGNVFYVTGIEDHHTYQTTRVEAWDGGNIRFTDIAGNETVLSPPFKVEDAGYKYVKRQD